MAGAPGLFGLSVSERSSGEMGRQSSFAAGAGVPNHNNIAAAADRQSASRLIALGGFTVLEDDLSIVAAFYNAEKLAYRRISLLGKSDPIHHQMPLYFHRVALLRGGKVVDRGARVYVLRLRNGLDLIARRRVEFHVVYLFIRVFKIDGVDAFLGKKYPGMDGGKQIGGKEHAAPGRGTHRG